MCGGGTRSHSCSRRPEPQAGPWHVMAPPPGRSPEKQWNRWATALQAMRMSAWPGGSAPYLFSGCMSGDAAISACSAGGAAGGGLRTAGRRGLDSACSWVPPDGAPHLCEDLLQVLHASRVVRDAFGASHKVDRKLHSTSAGPSRCDSAQQRLGPTAALLAITPPPSRACQCSCWLPAPAPPCPSPPHPHAHPGRHPRLWHPSWPAGGTPAGQGSNGGQPGKAGRRQVGTIRLGNAPLRLCSMPLLAQQRGCRGGRLLTSGL